VAELTQARLRELLNYNPETGEFTRLSGPKPGPIKRKHSSGGYIRIGVDGHTYAANRLAWLYVHGQMPARNQEVDHKNRKRDDNRIDNLRLATRSQNQGNSKRPKHNTSGFKGVSREKGAKRWHASISVKGRAVHLGYYDTPEEAHRVYTAAALQYFGEFANP
jgi:hypothetical protein